MNYCTMGQMIAINSMDADRPEHWSAVLEMCGEAGKGLKYRVALYFAKAYGRERLGRKS